MFLKPRSEHGELISPQHRESEKIGNLKINGMEVVLSLLAVDRRGEKKKTSRG